MVMRSSFGIGNKAYARAIQPYYLRAKKVELGVTMAKNIATIQRMRSPRRSVNIQERVLGKTLVRSKTVTGDVSSLAGKKAIQESKISGLTEQIFSLEKELRDRPVIEKVKPFWDLDLPDLGDLKKPLIVAAAVIGAALFLPSIIGAIKK